MSVIRILPDRVANQIAAGEVVERPASIVKELLENALDAGATRVEVEFRHGGRSFIRVQDNGCGMSADDALLSLERHATSKIREATDLDHIGTFGFRGEALPAIASVSRFQLQTRAAGAATGTEILVNAGKVVHVRDCGMPEGTRVEVSHLFNSVPARRKFLKSDATEAAHIIHHTRLHALANPQVSFALSEDGRGVFQSPVCRTLSERVGELFGRQIAADLIALEAREDDLQLTGLISRPGVARSTRHEMITFVNRRPVDSRTLAYALLESYQALIPKGRYPLAFVFVGIDPAGVDVNVHPAKREVRFRDEVRVRGFVIRAVLAALRGASGQADVPAAVAAVATPARAPTTPAPARGTPVVHPPDVRRAIASIERAVAPANAPRPVSAAVPAPTPAPPPTGGVAAPFASPVPRLDWRLLGNVGGGFSVFETPGGLVVLDRRAAAERIWFERLRAAGADQHVESQRLLLPVPLELDPVSSEALQERLPFLREHGLGIELFGRDFFRIDEVPVWLAPGEIEGFVRDIVGLIRAGRIGGRDLQHARVELARAGAVRAAKGALDTVAEEALERLVADLLRCGTPHVSPDGRPTYIEIGAGELARRFQKSPFRTEPDLG
jgi:DNA mismatch repair protein MutL